MPKSIKKGSTRSATLATIQLKLCHIHKDLEENKNDIAELKEQIAMGKGGIKALVWITAIIISIAGFNFFQK